MKSSLLTMVTGVLSVSSIEVIEKATQINPDVISESTSVIIQIIIGIVTLWKMFTKKKS